LLLMTATLLPPDRRALLARRIRLLVAATITYNAVEAVVAITAGVGASSTALIGFGLDSVIEVASAAAVAWQFSATDHERRERTTLRIIAVSFFALAAFVGVESVRALVGGHQAEHSTVGLVLAAVSLAVMPFLSAAQRRAGRQLGSASAVADSKQTLLCTYLSAVLLLGLAANSAFGWWWADPVAALVIAAVALKEGREAWRGDSCCVPTSVPAGPLFAAGTDDCCSPAPVMLDMASPPVTLDVACAPAGCSDGCCAGPAAARATDGLRAWRGPLWSSTWSPSSRNSGSAVPSTGAGPGIPGCGWPPAGPARSPGGPRCCSWRRSCSAPRDRWPPFWASRHSPG
jgi:hypothetical protein